MDKKQASRLLRDFRVAHDDCRRDPHSIQEDLDETLDGYAEAIAAQHEAEVAHLKARQLCGHPVVCINGSDEDTHCEMCELEGRAEKLLGQVAMMVQALADIKQSWWDKHYPADIFDGSSGDEGALEVVRIRAMLDKALSAAPRVLHSEPAKWDTEWLVWPVVRIQRPLMLDAYSPDDVIPGVSFCAHGPQRFDEFPGQQVEVFVVGSEQPQSSEQEEPCE